MVSLSLSLSFFLFLFFLILLLTTTQIDRHVVEELLSSPENGKNDDDRNSNNKNKNKNDEDDEWIKQSGSHRYSNYDFTIYYKIDTSSSRLTCRIESPIPSNMLIPLLSVLNESSLYETWIPSFKYPFRLGIDESKQVSHKSRGHQIIQVRVNVPWPFSKRLALFEVQAVDDIDKNGFIVAKMTTLSPTPTPTPTTTAGLVQCDFDGAVLFRACPITHPNYKQTKNKFSGSGNSNTKNTTTTAENNYNTECQSNCSSSNIKSNVDENIMSDNDDTVLVQFMCHFDAKISSSSVTQSIINFVTRTAIGVVWNMLLVVSEQVRDGKRTKHCAIINSNEKKDFYQWVQNRCNYMIALQQQQKKNFRRGLNENENEAQKHSTRNNSNNKTDHNSAKKTSNSGPSCSSNNNDDNKDDDDEWTLQEVLRMNT